MLSVIKRLKVIAAEHFDNRLYDNILAAFEKLSVNEKKTLLRNAVNLGFILEKSAEIQDQLKLNDVKLSSKISEADRLSLINMKSFLVKVVIVSVLSAVFLTVGTIVILGMNDIGGGSTFPFLRRVSKLVFTIFGG